MGLVCIVSVPKRRWYFVKFLELCRRQQRVQESTCIAKVSWNVALWSWQRDTINLFVHYPSFSVLGRMEHWNIYLSVSLHTTCCLLHLSLQLVNFPFPSPNSLTNTSVPENPPVISYTCHIDPSSPLQDRLSDFSHTLTPNCHPLCSLLSVANMWSHPEHSDMAAT